MKLLLTSDWHIDATTAGIRRLPEVRRYVDHLVDACRDQEVDVVANLGDYFDPGRVDGPRYHTFLVESAMRLHEAAAVGSIWLTGNHDVVETSNLVTTLSPLRAMQAACRDMESFIVAELPLAVDLKDVHFLLLPYVAGSYRDGYTPELSDRYARELARARSASREVPVVVLTHMTVPGAALGTESREFSRGRDHDLPMEALAELSPNLVAAGHYHRSQIVDGPVQVHVVGSPLRLTFGERYDSDKGYAIVEVR